MLNVLSIIIPCFNEEGNLKRYDNEVFPVFKSFPFKTDYIFVDDGSTDGTPQVLDAIQKLHPDIKRVRHLENRGLGASLQSGLAHSTGDAILTLDADLTFHPSEFKKLYDAYNDTVDAVLGSPFLGTLEGVPFYRRILSWGVNKIYRLLLGAPVTSTSSIFRLYRTAALKPLSIKSQSFNINAEILIKLLRLKRKITEVPVTITARTWGTSKINVSREIWNHLKNFAGLIYERT